MVEVFYKIGLEGALWKSGKCSHFAGLSTSHLLKKNRSSLSRIARFVPSSQFPRICRLCRWPRSLTTVRAFTNSEIATTVKSEEKPRFRNRVQPPADSATGLCQRLKPRPIQPLTVLALWACSNWIGNCEPAPAPANARTATWPVRPTHSQFQR